MLFQSPSGGRVEASEEFIDRLRAAGYTPLGETKPVEAKPKARRAPRKKTENEAKATGEE